MVGWNVVVPFSLQIELREGLNIGIFYSILINSKYVVYAQLCVFIVKEMIISSFRFTVGNNDYELLFQYFVAPCIEENGNSNSIIVSVKSHQFIAYFSSS